jgi:hypothetical protein
MDPNNLLAMAWKWQRGDVSRNIFSSGRLIGWNAATWMLSNQDSDTAPQASEDVRPVCGIKNFASAHRTRRRNCI